MHRDAHFIQTLQSRMRVISGQFQPNGASAPVILKKNGVKTISRLIPGVYVLEFEDDYNDLVSGQMGLQLAIPAPYEVWFGGKGLLGPRMVTIGVLDPTGVNAKKVTIVTCPADTGAYAITQITLVGGATMNNGYFFIWRDVAEGLDYLFYYVIDNVNPTLSGAAAGSIPFDRQIPIAIESTMTAPVVAVVTAGTVTALFGAGVTATSMLANVTLTQKFFGVIPSTTAFDATSGPTTNITPNDLSLGANSNLNGKAWFLYSANDANAYDVWYNVNGQGTHTAIAGKTPIEVAINTGDNSTNVATATTSAVGAIIGDFNPVTSALNIVNVTNANDGPTTDASAGTTTGFVFNVTNQGSLNLVDLPLNPNNIISYSFYFNDSSTGW